MATVSDEGARAGTAQTGAARADQSQGDKRLDAGAYVSAAEAQRLAVLSVSESLRLFEQDSVPLRFTEGTPDYQVHYNARFYQRREHRSDQPLLVCLHGYKNNLHSFADLIPRLGEPAVSLDLRGFGQSFAPEPPHIAMADYLLDLQRLLNHLQVARVWLVGHSLGARVSTVFAALFPEKVERVVLLDGFYRLHVGQDWMVRMKRFLVQAQEPPRPRPSVDAERLARFFLRQTPGMSEALAGYLGRQGHVFLQDGTPVADWQEWHNSTTPVSFADAFMQDAVDRIQCPTLAVQSEETPVGFQELTTFNPQVSVAHLAAGHQIHWQEPVGVAKTIQRWRAFRA